MVRIRKPLSDFSTLLSSKRTAGRQRGRVQAVVHPQRRQLEYFRNRGDAHNRRPQCLEYTRAYPPGNPAMSFKILTRHRYDRYRHVGATSPDLSGRLCHTIEKVSEYSSRLESLSPFLFLVRRKRAPNPSGRYSSGRSRADFVELSLRSFVPADGAVVVGC